MEQERYRIGERKMSDGTSEFFVQKERDYGIGPYWSTISLFSMNTKEEAIAFINDHKARVRVVETAYHDVE